MFKTTVIMILLFLPWGALAQENDQPDASEDILQAQDCPALFGDEEDREFNSQERESCLDSVQISDYTINLVHHGDWTEPFPVHLTGLELESIDCPEGLDETEDAKCHAVALLRLTDELESVDCPTGLYALEVDDSLGEDGRLIAILPDLLLLELEGQLQYLPLDSFQRPVWRIIWRSPWKIRRLPGQRNTGHSSRSSHRRTRGKNRRYKRR